MGKHAQKHISKKMQHNTPATHTQKLTHTQATCTSYTATFQNTHSDTLICTQRHTQMYTAVNTPRTNTRKHTYTKIQPSMQSYTQTHTLRNMCVHRCTKSLHCSTHRCTITEAHKYRAMYPLTLTDPYTQKVTHINRDTHSGYITTDTHIHREYMQHYTYIRT